jgi:tRNA-dihydrouridine synthase
MIARGALRNPFIFLESFLEEEQMKNYFTGADYWEAINLLHQYTEETFEDERVKLVQMRKLIVWFAAGFRSAAKFRGIIFQTKNLLECLKITEDYFISVVDSKDIDQNETFMTSGHG